MEFYERLKQLRQDRGLTQKKLGEILNYGSSAIANYESGRNQPSIPDLKKIARYFEVSLDYLLGEADISYPPQQPLTADEMKFMYNIIIKPYFFNDQELIYILRPTIRNLIREYSKFDKKLD